MLNLFADGIPTSPMDILLVPIGYTALGLAIFIIGWYFENRLNKAPWKWLGVLPVLYAAYIGWDILSEYRDNPAINMMLYGKKWTTSYYATFIIPVLGLLIIAAFHFFNHKLRKALDD